MSHWATAPLDRQQVTLFAPTLDDSLGGDHPVRLFDEVLRGIDFGDWERQYVLLVGQPPIHPRLLAGGILYGLSLGVRSSRKLEDSCCNRLDFIWLLEGRKPDHATFCEFRTRFGPQLKELFKKVGRVAIGMGMVTLNQVTLDGTDTKASNSRYKTARRASLERKLAALDEQVERAMREAGERDRAEDGMYGPGEAQAGSSPSKLPRDLKDLKRRQEKLKEAMAKLEAIEAERAKAGREGRKDASPKGPAVPLTDPDARVLPGKAGGFAPGYTSVLAVDGDSGIILDAQVLAGNDEASAVLPADFGELSRAVANVEENFGAKPKQLAADGNFNTGPNLAGLEALGVEPLMPPRQQPKADKADKADEGREQPQAAQAEAAQAEAAQAEAAQAEAAQAEAAQPEAAQPEAAQPEAARPEAGPRAAVSLPVLAAAGAAGLPMNPQSKVLDKSAFRYDAAGDCYTCPAGQALPFSHTQRYDRHGTKGTYRVYQAPASA
jgi:transposase